MIVGEDYAFVSVPKAATHTIYETLLSRFGGTHWPGRFHERVVPEGHRHKFTFTCVRNPYSRMVTIWYHAQHLYSFKRQLPATCTRTLEEFVAWLKDNQETPLTPTYRPMFRWLGAARLDRVIHVENLEEEFNALPFVKEPVVLPRLNPGRRLEEEGKPPYPDLEKVLTPEAVALINEFAGEDFERFGYERRDPA